MKILAIRGENLASLEGEFEIDFSVEPLLSAGIFAITGSTGAGKSTILDALCLALFDNAPRLSQAEKFTIEEESQDKISLRDSRNILRKGASSGYAEVEFFALNGDKYRSRWSLRRARDKANGSLQNTVILLENLSTNEPEKGTKKELLIRIIELIGLSFEQFTRAVLLAQGDFATFLKAKQTEKAELLEKLTGTEVYSKISTLIHTKTGEANAVLNILKQRLADVKLLSDEEIALQNTEKENLSKQTNLIKKELSAIEKKLNWIKQELELKQAVAQVEKEKSICEAKTKEAVPRYDYITQLESAQEIRDCYLEAVRANEQQKRDKLNLEQNLNRHKDLEKQFAQIEADLKLSKTALDELEENYEALKPEIEQARSLDLQIKTAREGVLKINEELQAQKKKTELAEKETIAQKSKLENIKKEEEKLHHWFEGNKQYKEIIPRVDLILKTLSDLDRSEKQFKSSEKGFLSGRALLDSLSAQLNLHEKEEERLNALLPTEILHLREKLIDGEPCAVCGALHHPFLLTPAQSDKINEQELEKAKKNLVTAITETKNSIEQAQKQQTELEVHTLNFKQQVEESMDELKVYFSEFKGWENSLKQGGLAKELSLIAKQWTENNAKQDNNSKAITALNIQIEAENKALNLLKEDASKQEVLCRNQEADFKLISEKRAGLLKGKTVDETEKLYINLKKERTQRYETLRTNKEKSESEKANLAGSISESKLRMEENETAMQKLAVELQGWLSSNKYGIDAIKLKDLLSKSPEWLSQEKAFLDRLKNQMLVLSTTLNERKQQIEKHQNSEEKPQEEETKESLQENFERSNSLQEQNSQRLGEIDAIQKADRQAKEQRKTFEKELKSKEEYAENWAKLNDLLGSASGNKFKTIAQGYTLDVLLDYANKQLELLTKRYKLEKIPNSLALQVIDNDMLGEVRPVHSLSGGESFLISLSLALGLSSLSSNRMKIESLFIDEGFGSLDIDTLSVAMDALDNLQTQGRKIGVISHVEEMKERINTQIQVIKASNGRSELRVVG